MLSWGLAWLCSTQAALKQSVQPRQLPRFDSGIENSFTVVQQGSCPQQPVWSLDIVIYKAVSLQNSQTACFT